MRLRNARVSASAAQQKGRQWSMHLIDGIAHALAAIADEDLTTLRGMLSEETVGAPALLEWLEAALDWEVSRRTGSCRMLNDPRITIRDQGTRESSLIALAALHTQLRDVAGVPDFFDVTANALCTVDGAVAPAHLH